MPNSHRRRFPRKKVAFPVQIHRVIRRRKRTEDLARFYFSGTEISAGGMGLLTDVLFRTGDLLVLSFRLPGEVRELLVHARVREVLVPPKAPQGGRIVRLSVNLAFEGLSADEFTYLVNYIGTTFLVI